MGEVAKSLGFPKTTRRGSLLAASRGRLISNEAVSTNVKGFSVFIFREKGGINTHSVPPSSVSLACVQFLSVSSKGPNGREGKPLRLQSATELGPKVLSPESQHAPLPARAELTEVSEGGG